ncbi:SDR family NAD(P)-dependent oxidoreductase [Novosphingobium sp.]|uniref:SDR family NAD(P)-dependent oxidoreductase n=1 Tax=Novosphingobium sp. TaxID=1874826 RepID=UPI002638D7FE|nr:SDR family NAD(P)-dependent oxidoreductase [Novosphingobium sp.]
MTMPLDDQAFSGRIALVTGAGAGLGRSYALRLARQGATVIVNNRAHPDRPSSAQAVVDEITAAGGTAIADHHSVQYDDQAKAMIDLAYDTYGRLDVLVCNAGVSGFGPLHEVSAEDFNAIFELNFYGTLHPVRAALARMYAAGYGRIVGTTSSAGFFHSPGGSAYAASKSALIGLFRSLSGEAIEAGVKVNLISPMAWSRMAEELLDRKYAELLDPEHCAKVVSWLASEACSVTGELLVAGGGQVYRATVVQSPGQPIGEGDIERLWPALSDLATSREVPHGMATVMDLMAAFDSAG